MSERELRECLLHADRIERMQFEWYDRLPRLPWARSYSFEEGREEAASPTGTVSLHLDYLYRLTDDGGPLDVHLLLRFRTAMLQNAYHCNMESKLQPVQDGRFEFNAPMTGGSFEEIVYKASRNVWEKYHQLERRHHAYATAMSWTRAIPEMFVNDHGPPGVAVPDFRMLTWPPPEPKPPQPAPETEIIRCRRPILRPLKPQPKTDPNE